MEALLERHTKRDGHLERSFERRRILVLFNGYNRLPCNSDLVGEVLLRHFPSGSELSNLIAYGGHHNAFR